MTSRASIEDSLEHLKLVLSASSMHTWSWDIASGRVDWSPGVAALAGLTVSEFGGSFEAYQRVLHPDDVAAVVAAVENAVADPDAMYDIEHRVLLPDGSIRFLACRGQVIRSEAGAPTSMLGIVWDITARKLAATRIADTEAALRRSEERKRMLVEHATDGIFLLDDTFRLREVNAAAEKMLGYGAGELHALRLTDVFAHEDESAASLWELDAAEASSTIVVERRMRRKDGTIFDVEVSATALPGGLKQAFIRDIRDRKELQARLLRADRLASLGRLAAGVAHEINNPLAYIALNHEIAAAKLELLPQGADVTAIRVAIAVAREGTDRVRRIVRELATFGRSDDEALTSVDLHRAIDSAFAIVENEIRHRARFTQSYGKRSIVRANASRLGQVLVNLLVNAADAIEEGSASDNEICVTTGDLDDGRIVVSVSDTGIGIKSEAKNRMFDPFFTTKPSGVGTGVGLWICHNIVTSLGGEIVVENNVGSRGATARVSLLAATEPVAPRATPSRPPPPLTRRARILVVDDEPAIGRAIAEVLSRHDVTVARGGREARELGRAGACDCVLCDLMMPDLGGPELYAAFETDGLGLEERMIFMTAESFVPRARAFLAQIPNRCLTKPFERRDLETIISTVLAEP
ncbi:hypothetical protein BH09MYX1_BH09MYX1_22170 [soil metagenome]